MPRQDQKGDGWPQLHNCQVGLSPSIWQPSIRLSIRMVAGFAEVIEREDFVVAGARYVPNRQFLSIPFRSELTHCAV